MQATRVPRLSDTHRQTFFAFVSQLSEISSWVLDPVLDEILLNGQPFYVHHNLYLCLLHLRSPAYALNIWVDAICINQADADECNSQVAMMSFIYSRAQKVVAWLGMDFPAVEDTSNIIPVSRKFTSMVAQWESGETRGLAAALAGQAQMRYSFAPEAGHLLRISESAYWTRLWVVQEVCLPYDLEFAYGPKIWSFEQLESCVNKEQPSAMARMIEARLSRHTAAMRLENLIERFARQACSELRDKVYGLVGLASDIRPYSGGAVPEDAANTYTNQLQPGGMLEVEPRRGKGRIRIDRLRSFYDIWKDVMGFVYFRAKPIQGRWNIRDNCSDSDISCNFGHGKMTYSLSAERWISAVRTAGIVQEALGQKVEEERRLFGTHEGSKIIPLPNTQVFNVNLKLTCHRLLLSYRSSGSLVM